MKRLWCWLVYHNLVAKVYGNSVTVRCLHCGWSATASFDGYQPYVRTPIEADRAWCAKQQQIPERLKPIIIGVD